MSHQLRVDTNVDATVWKYYRARKKAKKMIQGSVIEQYSKVRDCGIEILRTNLLLAVDLEINNSYGMVWISDKQNGLIEAISELFPHSEHRFYVKHFHNNFKGEHRGLLLKDILWCAAKSTTEQE
ncbi:hypothetical protein Ddye_022002 [Dipteronia dyeriana]|uniref:Uncharacterized protein n=1 Tax=Dipteronia dyeriana TaxID=168575 RepID=A0AAD9U2T9_9ROSI|nr:hypothetical protein Ddye_022002 [Dipteronia dyeriana]